MILTNRRGTVVSTAVFVFSAMSPFNGYLSGLLYSRMGG